MKTATLVMAPMYKGGPLSGGDSFFINLCIGKESEIHVCYFAVEDSEHINPNVKVHSPPQVFKRIVGLSRILDLIILSLFAVRSVLYVRSILRTQQVVVKTCYVASDFLPDVLGGLFAKLIFRCKVINCIFLMAPELRSVQLRYYPVTIGYHLSQFLSHTLIKKTGDLLFFCSNLTKESFYKKSIKNLPYILIHGGVNEPTGSNGRLLTEYDMVREKVDRFASVYFARLHPQKGVLNAIRVWQHILQVIPDAQFAIIGNGPQLAESRKLAKKLGISNHIEWLGYIPPQKLLPLVDGIRTVIHPVNYDTGGMAAVELTKYGIPMFCFEHPGMQAMYGDMPVYVSYPDVMTLASKIVEILEDDEKFNQMAKKSFEFSQHFYWPRVRSFFASELAKHDIVL